MTDREIELYSSKEPVPVINLHESCQLCNGKIEDGGFLYQHPRYGLVCERCPEFTDGGVKIEVNIEVHDGE